MAKKIYLSPSNQNGNLYSYGDTNEMEQCNRIAEAAEKHLERNGYTVKRAPKGQDMNKSISESNSWGADLHIPIHTNAGGGSGPLVMVYSKASGNTKYAQPIYDALLAISTGKKGYGVRLGTEMTAGNYMPSELSDTAAVAAYCECEFHDDKTLAKWIIEHVDNIGAAIAKGVCNADGKIGTEINLTNNASKGNYSGRIIPLNKQLKNLLERLLLQKQEKLGFCLENHIIDSERGRKTSPQAIVNWFSKLYKTVGIDGCSSHSGRRTFITNAAKNICLVGGSLNDVRLLAGHASLATTQRYIEYNTDAHKRVVELV